MKNNNNLLKTLFMSFIALGVATVTSMAVAQKKEPTEKCMGIAKAGKGDGTITVDGKDEEWISVPAGACEKFVGGRIYMDKK